MVSGFVTSPWLQLRIFSGEAREMRIESKSAIKFARSYGEDLKIASSFLKPKPKTLLATDGHRWTQIKQTPFLVFICVHLCPSVAHKFLVRGQSSILHLARLLHQFH